MEEKKIIVCFVSVFLFSFDYNTDLLSNTAPRLNKQKETEKETGRVGGREEGWKNEKENQLGPGAISNSSPH